MELDGSLASSLLHVFSKSDTLENCKQAFVEFETTYPHYFNNSQPTAELGFPLETTYRIYLEHQILPNLENFDANTVKLATTKAMDIAYNLYELNFSEGLPLIAMEDIFEMLTINQCESVFEVFESKIEKIKEMGKTKNGRLRLLRVTNSLLSRLSKSMNARLNGRLLLFTSLTVPLCDKSGLNSKGVNSDNIIEFESDEQIIPGAFILNPSLDSNPDYSKPIDYNFYRTFWGLQKHFRNPADIIKSQDVFNEFIQSSSTVIDAFISSTPFSSSTSVPEDAMDVSSNDNEIPVFLKYLTSTKLLNVQLKDEEFRRFILLQFLILFHTLENSEPELSSDYKENLQKLSARVRKLLDQLSKAAGFTTQKANKTLDYENNWSAWKKKNCPDFERPPGKFELKKQPAPPVANNSEELDLGNDELTRLWNLSKNNRDCLEKENFIPSVRNFVEDQLLDEDSDEEEEYKLKNRKTFVWKSIRLMARNQISLIGVMGYQPNVEPLRAHFKEKRAKEEKDEMEVSQEEATSAD